MYYNRAGNELKDMEKSRSWPSAHDWKSCIPQKGIEGSNPSFSAIKKFLIFPKNRKVRNFFDICAIRRFPGIVRQVFPSCLDKPAQPR